MSTEPRCARCGEVLTADGGRFCTNCGAPRDGLAPAAAVLPVAPTPPPPPRERRRRRRLGAVGWLAFLVALLALVGGLVHVVTRLVDAPGTTAQDSGPTTAPAPTASPSGPLLSPSPSPSTAPDGTAGFTGRPEDLASRASAAAPRHDEDSVDITTGRPTSYDASNMLDDRLGTAWRVEGDATGLVLTFAFDAPVTLTSVGLVNGYAKTAVDDGRELNLYSGSRRVKAVEWRFDGGEPVPQDLRRTRDVQVIDVGAVQARTVTLTLTEVSNVGGGRAARDTTAVSEVALTGYPEVAG